MADIKMIAERLYAVTWRDRHDPASGIPMKPLDEVTASIAGFFEMVALEAAALVKEAVEAEREACAQVAERCTVMHGDQYGGYVAPSLDGAEIAAAIRRRSNG